MPVLSFTAADGRHVLLDHDDVRRVELHPRKPIAHVHTYDGQQYEVHGAAAAGVATAFVGGSSPRPAATPLPGSAPSTDGASPPARGPVRTATGDEDLSELVAVLGAPVASVDEADIPEGAVVVETFDADAAEE